MSTINSKYKHLNYNDSVAIAIRFIEHISGEIIDHKIKSITNELTKDLKLWLKTEKHKEEKILTDAQAETLPSSVIYRKYVNQLLDLSNLYSEESKEYYFIAANYLLLMFSCWKIDAYERYLNPKKQFVLASDITDGSDEWLEELKEWCCKVAKNYEKELIWQKQLFK